MSRFAITALMFALAACGPGAKGGPSMMNHIGGNDVVPVASPVVSSDILAREPVANSAQVKHILISWKELEDNFQGHQDARAQKRSKADAETVVKQLVGQLKAGSDFDAMMKASSEDLGSASSGIPMTVTPNSQYVIEFRQLSTRLHIGEIGVCQSDFGFHIIKRLQ